MAEEEKDKEEEGGKKGSKTKLLVIIILLVLLLGGGAGAFFLVKGKSGAAVENEEETEETFEEGGDLPGAIFPMEAFIVNLRDKGSYLKTTIQLELIDPEVPATMTTDTGKIRDSVINVLSSKTAEELLQPDGRTKLKTEIVAAVNETLGGDIVANVYITEFIIQ